jgi:hypothetical protein
MKKRISHIKHICLNEVTRRRQGGSIKKHWEIECLAWGMLWPSFILIEEVRDICDPLRNKSGKDGIKWKFRSRVTAEQCYTFLALKYS